MKFNPAKSTVLTEKYFKAVLIVLNFFDNCLLQKFKTIFVFFFPVFVFNFFRDMTYSE